jgi:2-keto-4-pentenoate hydratase/2-oxohepta-3-ene-1,7-dioic acid hydratase in catechol pathway
MKLVTFQDAAGPRIGAVTADLQHVVDLQAAQEAAFGRPDPALASMLALMDAGPAGLERADALLHAAVTEAIRPLAGLKLLAPVPEPRQLRDFSVFEKHLLQCGATISRLNLTGGAGGPKAGPLPEVWYRQPVYYKGNRFSVVGTDTTVEWPSYAKLMDYELEFGVFIGKRGRNIPPERAMEHVFGYCIYNDFSARDAQFQEMPGLLGPAKGKDFDTGNAMGPWLVTRDEVPDPYALTMSVRVNGEERGRGHSGEMHHRFEAMIVHVSMDETLHVGEFLGSGTVGNGCGLEFGQFLNDGDVVELEVTGLGILRNTLRKP